MTNKIIIVAHAPLASALRDCALHVYACDTKTVSCISAVDVAPDCDVRTVSDSITASLAADCSYLILTDIAGASPANIANKLLELADVKVLSGANLPMVLSALCHIDQPFGELAKFVKNAGILSVTLTE